jgi:8-oxo-dGTP pyrophosphatase MutT (NUDIX family)
MTHAHTHWGKHGAAGLLVVDKGTVLLQLRPEGVHEPHTWSIPGGARGHDETPEDAALREAAEEAGIDPQAVKIVAHYTHPCACGWEYVTCVATPTGPSTLRQNWESERLELVPLDDVDALPLHPGFKAAWPALRDMLKADNTQPNITQVTDRLWTGGDRGRTSMATWLAQLQSAGIGHVIDCRPHGRADQAYAQAHAPHVDYLLAGQPDNGQTMPDDWFADGVDFALHAMRDPAAQVLVHCQLGINRGPSMAYAILLAQGMKATDALATIRAARPIARVAYAKDAADWWAKLTAPEEIWYHGGAPGLHVGDFLLPPASTGAITFLDRYYDASIRERRTLHVDIEALRQRTHQDEDHLVYVTKNLAVAAYFARQCSPVGNVYQVEPLGKLTDFSALRFQRACDRARIVAVVDVPTVETPWDQYTRLQRLAAKATEAAS